MNNALSPIACMSVVHDVEIKDIHFSPAFRKKAEKWVNRIKSTIIKVSGKLDLQKVKRLEKRLVNSYYNWVVQAYKTAQIGKDKSIGYGKPLRIWKKGRVLNIKELVKWRTRAIKILYGQVTYKPKMLKRIYIPKPDGTERPLSIPTWFDKIIQGLIGSIVESKVESTINQNGVMAFGFRKGFKTSDAVGKIQKYAISGKYQKIIEFDIEKFYDTIPHGKLLETLGEIDSSTKNNIEKMLKTESRDLKGIITNAEKGTPPGGVISPVLANLYAINQIMIKFKSVSKSRLIMYADDGLIIVNEKEDPEKVLDNLREVVKKAGLKLKDNKTKIINGERFNFCGFEIRRGKGIRLKKDMVKKCKKDCIQLIKDKSIPTKKTIEKGSRKYLDNTPNHKFETVYPILNKILPKIRGVIEYGRDFLKTPMRKQLGKMVWDISQAIFKRRELKLPEIPIRKRTKSIVYFSPKAKSFYLDMKEWKDRIDERKWNKIEQKLIKRQNKICPFCKSKLEYSEPTNIHHLRPIKDGGNNSVENLQLIHTECHNQLHYQQIQLQKSFVALKPLIEIRKMEKTAKEKYQETKRLEAIQKTKQTQKILEFDSGEVEFRKWLIVKGNKGLAKKLKKIGIKCFQDWTDEQIYPILVANGIRPSNLQGNPTLSSIQRIMKATQAKK